MRKLLLALIVLPFTVLAQNFTKIDHNVVGFTQGVHRPSVTLRTADGHIWFNSLVNSRYRLYEYDGSTYSYYATYFEPSVSADRDINASYFAQADDGLMFTTGGQVFENGTWNKTSFAQTIFCQSQDKSTSYFLNFAADTVFAYSNGSFTNYPIALNENEDLKAAFDGIEYIDAAADNNGNIYFATDDIDLVKVNLATKTITPMPIIHHEEYEVDPRCLHIASNGNIYVGGNGYFAYHDGTNWTEIVTITPFSYFGRVDDIAEDPSGRIWIGSQASSVGGFLARFDENDPSQFFDMIKDTSINKDYISNRNIEAIYIENDSTFYFGVYQESYLLKATTGTAVTGMNAIVQSNIDFYPNPAQNSIQFKSSVSGLATVYSLDGQAVLEQQVTNNQLNTETLTNGTYLFQLETQNGQSLHGKFVKE